MTICQNYQKRVRTTRFFIPKADYNPYVEHVFKALKGKVLAATSAHAGFMIGDSFADYVELTKGGTVRFAPYSAILIVEVEGGNIVIKNIA